MQELSQLPDAVNIHAPMRSQLAEFIRHCSKAQSRANRTRCHGPDALLNSVKQGDGVHLGQQKEPRRGDRVIVLLAADTQVALLRRERPRPYSAKPLLFLGATVLLKSAPESNARSARARGRPWCVSPRCAWLLLQCHKNLIVLFAKQWNPLPERHVTSLRKNLAVNR